MRGFRSRPPRRYRYVPCLERLEARTVLSGPNSFIEFSDTALFAFDLGDLGNTATNSAAELGAIGDGGAADVDWFSFSLSQAARVSLRVLGQGGLDSLLGVYAGDAAEPFGLHRIVLADDSATSPDASTNLALGAGVYWVAVSGYGNDLFHPGIAQSGTPGSTDEYQLQIRSELLASEFLQVIAVNPERGSILNRSPLVLTATFNLPVDPAFLDPAAVELLRSGDAVFTPQDDPISLAGLSYDYHTQQIVIQTETPLGVGHYRLTFKGDRTTHELVIADVNGSPLGASSSNLDGRDFTTTFRIAAVEGGTLGTVEQPDDTLATAHALGVLTGGAVRQATGVIGDDPTDPIPFNANDVDLYRFEVAGPGRFALAVEAHAGRLNSFLDVSVQLFDADGNWLRGNDNTANVTYDELGIQPLFTDALLFAGLTEGTYYLAVTGGGNLPTELGGMFDPLISHSGDGSFSLPGEYVLRVALTADNTAPRILQIAPGEGGTLAAPPTHVVARFSEAVDLEALDAGLQITNGNGVVAAGVRRVDWDEAAHQATFLVMSPLENGEYHLHLNGVTDLAGNRLSDGDYVIAFAVQGLERGTNGDPLRWTDLEPNDSTQSAQVIGALFPSELDSGVTIAGALSNLPGVQDHADYFRVSFSSFNNLVVQMRAGDPANLNGLRFEIVGVGFVIVTRNGQVAAPIDLPEGEYLLKVSYAGWSGGPQTVSYQVVLSAPLQTESPQPLRVSPNPAIQISLPKRTPAAPLGSGVVSNGGASFSALLVATRPAGQDALPGKSTLLVGLPRDANVILNAPRRDSAGLAGIVADRRYAGSDGGDEPEEAINLADSWPLLRKLWQTGQSWMDAMHAVFFWLDQPSLPSEEPGGLGAAPPELDRMSIDEYFAVDDAGVALEGVWTPGLPNDGEASGSNAPLAMGVIAGLGLVAVQQRAPSPLSPKEAKGKKRGSRLANKNGS